MSARDEGYTESTERVLVDPDSPARDVQERLVDDGGWSDHHSRSVTAFNCVPLDPYFVEPALDVVAEGTGEAGDDATRQ